MRIRPCAEADLDALRRMHVRQGFDYTFPDLRDPIFISTLVVEDDAGRVVMASLARLTCEIYLLADRDYESGTTRNHVIPPALSGVEGNPAAVCVDGGEGSASGFLRHRATADPSSSADETGGLARDDNLRKGSAALRARQRYAQLLTLHAAGERDLLARGLDDAHAWLPPQIVRRFGRSLEAIGWIRDDAWTPYCRCLKSSG